MQIINEAPHTTTRVIPRRSATQPTAQTGAQKRVTALRSGVIPVPSLFGPGRVRVDPTPGPGLLEKIASDIASIPGGLWDLINQTGERVQAGPQTFDPLTMGDVTADVTEQAIRGTVENWRHPGKYFDEHPGFFLADLAAAAFPAAKLGRGVLGQAAGRLDVSIPEFLSSDTGAIGAFGRRLESGELPATVRYERRMAGTASSPSLGSARFENPNEVGQVLMKKTGGDVWSQGEQEIASMELNRLSGGRLRLPGVQEHPAIPYGGENPRPGALIEHIEEIPGEGIITPSDIRDLFARSRRPPDMSVEEQMGLVRQDLRDISLFDVVTGNPDRWFRQNLGAYGGRPLAYDQGLALNSRSTFGVRRPGDFFAPTEVWKPKGSLGYGELTPDELEWLDALEQALQNPSPSLMRNAGPDAIRQAIKRAQSIARERNLFSPGTSIPGESYARRKITGGSFPDEAAIGASRLVQELRDAAAQAGNPSMPGPGNWFGNGPAPIGLPTPSSRFIDTGPRTGHTQAWEEAHGPNIPPPPPESQFPTPTLPPTPTAAQNWAGQVMSELDKVLGPGERQLMRAVVAGMEVPIEALDWLRKVWAKRGQGPFPAFRIGPQI